MERSAPCILPDDSIEAFLRLDSQHSTIIIRQLFLPPQKGWNFFVQFVEFSSSRKYSTSNCKYPQKETFRLVSSYFNSINSHPRSQAGRMLWPPDQWPPPVFLKPLDRGNYAPITSSCFWIKISKVASGCLRWLAPPLLQSALPPPPSPAGGHVSPPTWSLLPINLDPPSLSPSHIPLHPPLAYPTIKPGLPQIEDTYPFPGTKTFSPICFIPKHTCLCPS